MCKECEKTNIPIIARKIILQACVHAAHEANRAYCIAIGDNSQPYLQNLLPQDLNNLRLSARDVISGNTTDNTELPVEQRIKNELFVNIVNAMHKALMTAYEAAATEPQAERKASEHDICNACGGARGRWPACTCSKFEER